MINCTELFKILGLFGISASLITGLIAFLGKKYVELYSQKKLEEAKNNLLKNAAEFQIKISGLHAERLEAIKLLYAKLSELHESVFILVIAGNGDSSNLQQVEKLYELYYDLRKYFNSNRILFNRKLCELIEDTIQKIHTSLFKFKGIIEKSNRIEMEYFTDRKKYLERIKREDWDLAADLIEKEVPKLQEKLENEFRKLIGVE